MGDLKDIELKYFDKDMSRSKSGDIKIIGELLELVSANGKIISKFLDGTLDLGAVGSLLELDMSQLLGDGGFAGILKDALVGIVYPDSESAEYKAACELARRDFDTFLFGELMGKLVPIDGFAIDTKTTVNNMLSSICAIFADEYLLDFLRKLNVDLSTTGLAALDGKVVLDGDLYDYTSIKVDTTKSVTAQINDFFGVVFGELVPGYAADGNTWATGDYTKLDANIVSVFRYLANALGIANADTISKDAVITGVINEFVKGLDLGDYEK